MTSSSKKDCVIGKNSNKFDNKHINIQRLWHDLPGDPDWIKYTDDIEQQLRKFFNAPSYSLDYFSQQLGLGGKNSMEFDDWVAINQYRLLQILGKKFSSSKAINEVCLILFGQDVKEIEKKGKMALKKMFTYGLKDSDDSTELFKKCSKHFKLKFNHATYYNDDMVCPGCGSFNLIKHAKRTTLKGTYQRYMCKDCGTTCQRPINRKSGKEGRMG